MNRLFYLLLVLITPAHAGDTITQEVACLGEAVYYEARGEPLLGQIAVAKVVINRVIEQRWKDTVCQVVHQRYKQVCQFSYACETAQLFDPVAWRKAMTVARLTYQGRYNAYLPARLKIITHYHTVDVSPAWAKKLYFVGQIGRHRFYSDFFQYAAVRAW